MKGPVEDVNQRNGFGNGIRRPKVNVKILLFLEGQVTEAAQDLAGPRAFNEPDKHQRLCCLCHEDEAFIHCKYEPLKKISLPALMK